MKSCLFWIKEKNSKKYVQCFGVESEDIPLFLIFDNQQFKYVSSIQYEPAVLTTSEACQKGWD